MKILLALLSLISIAHAEDFHSISGELRVRAIGDGVWEAQSVGHGDIWANAILVDTRGGERLLVDTPWTPEETRALLDWADRKLGKRHVTAVNTHFHADRTGGNAALLARGARVIASARTAELLKTREPTIPLPTETPRIDDRLALTIGGERVELIFPGAGHTQDNLVVFLPARKLLVGGCFIVGMPKLGFTGDADLPAWPRSLAKLMRLDAQTVVPGHGDRLDRALLDHTMELVR